MRVFFKDVVNVSEITKEINRYKSDTYLLTMTTSDAIYVATDFPLNHLYVKMGEVVNTVSSVMEISYWSASGWTPVANINDYTYGLTESGFIDFTPDINESWLRQDTNSSGVTIDELSDVKVYGQYWIKIKFDTNLLPAIELEWIGNKFSDDVDLFSEFPIFNDSTFLTGYEAGKTNWEEQHIKAADLIIQDLKRKNIILGKEQILERDVLLPAATAKVAEIIFNAFGNDYRQQRQDAAIEYSKRIDLSKFVVDLNENAIKDQADIISSQGWLNR